MAKYRIRTSTKTVIETANINDGLIIAFDVATIDRLIADEEAAISAYANAILDTQSTECKDVYRHIRNEEVEHLKELKNLKYKLMQCQVNDGHFSQKAANPDLSSEKEIDYMIRKAEEKYGVKIVNMAGKDRRFTAHNVALVVAPGSNLPASEVDRINKELSEFEELY